MKRKHLDPIAERSNAGSFRCGLIRRPVSIPEAKAAVNKEWEN